MARGIRGCVKRERSAKCAPDGWILVKVLTICDLQLQIRRDPGRLDRRDIGTYDFCLGELVGKVAAPRLV